MKLPWIARASHDEAMALVQRLASAEHENAQQLRRENADLLAKYHMLRLQGYAPAEPIPAPVTRPEPDAITKAIHAKAGTNRQLRVQMAAQAQADREAGKNEAEIEQRILRGVSVEELFV